MPLSVEARAKLAFAAFLVLLALGAAAWFWWGREQHHVYELHSSENVSGLIAGSPVEFHGVEVGKVDDVQLVDPTHVRVLVGVRKDVPVTTATVATIMSRGLAARGFTGYVFVSLEDRPGGGQPLVAQGGSRYPVIASAPSQAVSLDRSISQLNENVQVVVGLLHDTLDKQTIASVKQTLHNLDEVAGNLAANNARLSRMIANAEASTAQMPRLMQAGSDTLHTMQMQLLPQATDTMTRMNGLVTTTADTVQTMRTQLLPEAQRTVTQLDQVTNSLADTADAIRRNPTVLVRGSARRPGPGEAP